MLENHNGSPRYARFFGGFFFNLILFSLVHLFFFTTQWISFYPIIPSYIIQCIFILQKMESGSSANGAHDV